MVRGVHRSWDYRAGRVDRGAHGQLQHVERQHERKRYLYGFVLPTNPDPTVEDLRAPNNNTIKILAVDVVNQPEQVNLGDATDDAIPADDAVGISVDSRTEVAGGADTYSAKRWATSSPGTGRPLTSARPPSTSTTRLRRADIRRSRFPRAATRASRSWPCRGLRTDVGHVLRRLHKRYHRLLHTRNQLVDGGLQRGGSTAAWESVAASMALLQLAKWEPIHRDIPLWLRPADKPRVTVMDLRTPNNTRFASWRSTWSTNLPGEPGSRRQQ